MKLTVAKRAAERFAVAGAAWSELDEDEQITFLMLRLRIQFFAAVLMRSHKIHSGAGSFEAESEDARAICSQLAALTRAVKDLTSVAMAA
jgi:hypothetical protein